MSNESTQGEITAGVKFLESWESELMDMEAILETMAETIDAESTPAACGTPFKLRNMGVKVNAAFRTVDSLLGAVSASKTSMEKKYGDAPPGLPLGKKKEDTQDGRKPAA